MKQASLDWSLKRGASSESVGESEKSESQGSHESKYAFDIQPFKKLKSFSSDEAWKSFNKDNEDARLRRIQEAKEFAGGSARGRFSPTNSRKSARGVAIFETSIAQE